MNTTKKTTTIIFSKLILNGLIDRPILLNTLFLFRFRLAYHAIGVNAITLADALCECLQVDGVAVWLYDILRNRKALNCTDKQASPLGDVKLGVACYINHNGTHHKTDICNQFGARTPNTS